jgi:UvrB/uvrC motif
MWPEKADNTHVMRDSIDLRRVLQSWPYDPDKDARLTQGEDGREILQVRTPVGLEQYELEGRPDGVRPHGMESALEFYLQRLERAKAAGKQSEFELDPRDCAELFNEGTIYYFRYVRLFQLKDWHRTIRDTSRNIRVFDLVKEYARRPEDRMYLEKWRPYIIRVNTTAAIMLELEKGHYDEALHLTDEAVTAIEGLEGIEDETFEFERDRSLEALRELAAQVRKNRPLSELEQLEQQLRRAIERQEFERAAQLRDRIRALKKQQIC